MAGVFVHEQHGARRRVWSGRAALERGLVDELGGMELALTRVRELANIPAEADVKLQRYPAPKTGLELLFEMSGSEVRLPRELRELLTMVRGLTREVGEQSLRVPYVPRL